MNLLQRLQNLFITGTDTGVGKTFVTSLLVRALRQAGVDCVGMKPICCGDRADAEELAAAAGGCVSVNEINPVWLRTPAAPYTASMIEERMIDLDQIRDCYKALCTAHESVLVEGVGGWLVPIRRDYGVADLAADFGRPIAVVVRNQLGAINHTLLTVENIRRRGLECAGLILNNTTAAEDVASATNASILENLVDLPILLEVHPQEQNLRLESSGL